MKTKKPLKIFIDFDGTICPNKFNKKDYKIGAKVKYPPPTKNCVATIKRLYEEGHEIIIFSVRSNLLVSKIKDGHDKMVAYLKKHKIPFTSIDSSKPHYSIIIDDKNVAAPLTKDLNIDWDVVCKYV